MTFNDMLADCYRRLRFSPTPANAIITRLKAEANEAHRELLALPGLMRLRDDTLPIVTTANQAQTALPQAVGRIRYLTDHVNRWKIKRVSVAQLREEDPGQTAAAGNPIRYAEVGWRQVALPPSDASRVFGKSSDPGDVQSLFIEGVRSGGALSTETITLNGTTAVGSVRTDYVLITKCYLSSAAVGEVTLQEDSGSGTELARISIGQGYARYLTVEWDPIPTSAAVLYADITRNVLDMANATDEPLLPVDFHYLIPLRVRMKEYELSNDSTRFLECKPEWTEGKAALRSWVLNDADQVASLRKETGLRWSQLGPMYPAGS